MNIEITESDLGLLYQKAREYYYECINSEENEFLREEVSFPLELIALKNTNIKIVFSNDTSKEYTLEAHLTLYYQDSEVGKYTYYENEAGVSIDDNLVFY